MQADDVTDDETPAFGTAFADAMRRVILGEAKPGIAGRRGCVFPVCGCAKPWKACEAKFNALVRL